MKLLSPTESKRWNELGGFVFLAFGLLILFSLVSYRTYDPSWNTAAGNVRPQNLAGYLGAYLADFLWQIFGLSALLLPVCAFLLGWKWIRSEAIDSPGVKLAGFLLLGFSICAGLGEGPELRVFGLPASGVIGMLLAHSLVAALNRTGAVIVTITATIVSVYLVSTFTLSKLPDWFAGPIALFGIATERLKDWFNQWHQRQWEKRRERERAKAEARATARAEARAAARRPMGLPVAELQERPSAQPRLEFTPDINEIPICPL